MYESHFGFTGTPFSLNADPAFFFGTSGHSNALSYLKFGVFQGEGFVVVTGEIGAGKTMLVRTLLAGLESEQIVAAQIVSTQLEAGDLLRSIALAFGIAPKNLSKAELIGTIEAFLMLLATEERRALLIVDEAQNLEPAAVEELRMLSNFQLGNQALLQSFLIGQPELRELLTSKSMEQFRQRVIASCHLGPMTAAETRAYIEHRLRQVGWAGSPSFGEGAMERIFYWSGGIPRRVNLLCNRVLLALFLGSGTRLDASLVDLVGEELRTEIGEPSRTAPIPASARAPVSTPMSMTAAARERSGMPAMAADTALGLSGPLVVATATPWDDVKAAVLLRAWKKHSPLRQGARVRLGLRWRAAENDEFCRRLCDDALVLTCELAERWPIARIAEIVKRFGLVVADLRPSAVAVFGDSDAALACSLVAFKAGCRLVHLDAGLRGSSVTSGDTGNGEMIDRLAHVFYPSRSAAWLNLVREGERDADVLCAGSLLADAVQAATTGAPSASPLLLHRRTDSIAMDFERGYGLVEIDESFVDRSAEWIAQFISMLHELSREKPLIWLLDHEVASRLDATVLRGLAVHERIDVVAPVVFVDGVKLLRRASFVVTDSADLEQAAAAFGVRSLWAGAEPHIAFAAANALPQPGEAAPRIAEHLTAWMAAHAEAAR